MAPSPPNPNRRLIPSLILFLSPSSSRITPRILGLSCGGGKGKGNNAGTSSENHNLEGGGDRSAKVIDDFKNFLHPTTSQRPAAEQSSEPPPQNFFNDLSKAPTADAEASTKPLWVEDKAMKEAGSSKIKEEARVDMH
ncbi:hypothetical protein YC2023_001913 [Brassica napus]